MFRSLFTFQPGSFTGWGSEGVNGGDDFLDGGDDDDNDKCGQR